MPSDMPASMAAPRSWALSGSSTCSIVRSMTSAWIWHHSSDTAPPPTMRIGSSRCFTNFST